MLADLNVTQTQIWAPTRLTPTKGRNDDHLLALTVRWHAVALRVVSVRRVRPWRLQGGAVLSLSVGGHAASPGQTMAEKDQRGGSFWWRVLYLFEDETMMTNFFELSDRKLLHIIPEIQAFDAMNDWKNK